MNILRCVGFLLLTAFFANGQASQQSQRADLSRQAETPVQKVYQGIVSRPIGGIPTPERMKVFAPYLSSSLLHRINEARACGNDWFRLHPQNDVKAPFAWGEFGLFSGANDRSGPRTFSIEKTESGRDGSVQVYVGLTGGIPPEKPWSWRVAAIVVNENRHSVIDDVIYLKDNDSDTDYRLTEVLARGCNGSHWIGYKDP